MPKLELLGCMLILRLSFWRTARRLSKATAPSAFPPALRGSQFFYLPVSLTALQLGLSKWVPQRVTGASTNHPSLVVWTPQNGSLTASAIHGCSDSCSTLYLVGHFPFHPGRGITEYTNPLLCMTSWFIILSRFNFTLQTNLSKLELSINIV